VEQLVLGNRPTHSVAKVPAGLDGARQTHGPTGIGLSQTQDGEDGQSDRLFPGRRPTRGTCRNPTVAPASAGF